MNGLFKDLSPEARKLLRRSAQPEWTEPMLATLTDRRFSSPDWIFEPKLDGYRALAFRKGRSLSLFSRNKIPMNTEFPEIARALAAEPLGRFVVDGEIVALRDGLPSFQELQRRAKRLQAKGVTGVSYYVFDILHADGWDLTALPLLERKKVLRAALRLETPLAYVSHVEREGEKLYAEACRKRWEGLLAKRAASAYVPRRSQDWLKFKCVNAQEFVIAGFTDPGGAGRTGFGALLLGYYDGAKLRYAGKVGAGYDEETLETLGKRLRGLETSARPFDEPGVPRGAHWVRPSLVAQVGFTEWTGDGRLRHPVFEGLRRDKPARAVTRERIKKN